jgi:hypothetical protein
VRALSVVAAQTIEVQVNKQQYDVHGGGVSAKRVWPSHNQQQQHCIPHSA